MHNGYVRTKSDKKYIGVQEYIKEKNASILIIY